MTGGEKPGGEKLTFDCVMVFPENISRELGTLVKPARSQLRNMGGLQGFLADWFPHSEH